MRRGRDVQAIGQARRRAVDRIEDHREFDAGHPVGQDLAVVGPDPARAEQRQLSALLEQAGQRLQHQVQPFLAGQAAHHREERHFVVDLQPHCNLQLAFVFRFVFHGIATIACRQQEIGFRTPDLFIHAVQNARQAAFPMALLQ